MNKRKLIFAVVSLLLCLAVLLSASFAWVSLSRAPEITGIDTYIGSNGNLELALLSDATYMDPSAIQSKIGDSAVIQEITTSNLSWGNVLDLSDESYGLNQITMIPSRLNTFLGENGQHILCTNMLIIPQFGIDGRFSEFEVDTVSATYNQTAFSYTTGIQGYGVRGIGTVDNMTLQQSALANARSRVKSYQSASISTTVSVWASNGSGLLDIYYRRYSEGHEGFDDQDVAVLRDTASKMLNALSYLDLALRQAVVGYAASSVEDEESFRTLRESVENTAIPLSMIVAQSNAELPSGFADLIDQVEQDKLEMHQAIAACDYLSGGFYPWDMIEQIARMVLDEREAYLGNETLDTPEAYAQMTRDNTLTLSPDAGVMAHIADYSGNYQAFFTYSLPDDPDPRSVEVSSSSVISPPHLTRVSQLLEECTAASGDASVTAVDLEDVFGYAVDMAFRSNQGCDLLLQTVPEQRIQDGSDAAATQGSGSYMRFRSEQLTTEQIVLMMDAIRIGFLDNQSNLISIAKLNTSNYTESEDGISAPLYLYDFSISPGGSISMGERLAEQSPIAPLPDDTAMIITIVVWLDGDHVDNSLAGVTSQSMDGSLNLQFSSSVNLLPSTQIIKEAD